MKEHKVLQDNLETEQGINFFPHLPILNHGIFATNFFNLQGISMQKLKSQQTYLTHKG